MQTERNHRRRIRVLLGLVLLLGLAVLCCMVEDCAIRPVSGVQLAGGLSRKDLAEIHHLVQREIWRGVLPTFYWSSIKYLPEDIRQRASERIRWITVKSSNTAEITTVVKGRNLLLDGKWTDFQHHTYILNKGQTGWRIIETRQWDHCQG